MHFGAGNRISFGLTAVVVVSQYVWASEFINPTVHMGQVNHLFKYHSFSKTRLHILGIVSLCFKYGIAGPLFYTTTWIIAPALFPIFALHLKLYAPGARTYLQVIYARFGKLAHVIFCFAALLLHAVSLSILATGQVLF